MQNFTDYYIKYKHELPYIIWRETSPQHFENGMFDEIDKKCECSQYKNSVIDRLNPESSEFFINALGLSYIYNTSIPIIPIWLPTYNIPINIYQGECDCTHYYISDNGQFVHKLWNN
eukprot:UN07854